MNKSAKKSIEKSRLFIEKAVKEIKSVEKKVKSLKTINNVSKDIKTTVIIKSEKFDRWVKTLSYGARKIMYALPLILFRVCSLLVINKTLYKNIIKKYDAVNIPRVFINTSVLPKKMSWKNMSFIEKVYEVLSRFFNELYEKPVTFLAEIVLVTTIFLDDIPSIFNSENYKLKDLEKIRKIDIASNTAKKYLEAAEIYTTHTKQQENNKIQGKFDREMDRFDKNLAWLEYDLKTHNTALDCLASIKNPTKPFIKRKPELSLKKKTEILMSHIPKPRKVVLDFPDKVKNLEMFNTMTPEQLLINRTLYTSSIPGSPESWYTYHGYDAKLKKTIHGEIKPDKSTGIQ